MKEQIRTFKKIHETINDRVKETICMAFNIPIVRLLEKTRKREIVIARQVYFFFLTTTFCITTTEIQDKLKFNHATVIHSKKTIYNLMETDRIFRKEMQELKREMTTLKAITVFADKPQRIMAKSKQTDKCKIIHRSLARF